MVLNLDLQKVYDEVLDSSCLQRKSLVVEGDLKELPSSANASLELQVIIQQLYLLQNITDQVLD